MGFVVLVVAVVVAAVGLIAGVVADIRYKPENLCEGILLQLLQVSRI